MQFFCLGFLFAPQSLWSHEYHSLAYETTLAKWHYIAHTPNCLTRVSEHHIQKCNAGLCNKNDQKFHEYSRQNVWAPELFKAPVIILQTEYLDQTRTPC